jgi:hypothetical protein
MTSKSETVPEGVPLDAGPGITAQALDEYAVHGVSRDAFNLPYTPDKQENGNQKTNDDDGADSALNVDQVRL